MKNIYPVILLSLVCFLLMNEALGQSKVPRINITNLTKDSTITKFDGDVDITEEVISDSSDGFVLNIDKSVKVNSIGLRNDNNGDFKPGPKAKDHTKTWFFTVTQPYLNTTTYHLDIKLYPVDPKGKSHIITLVVKKRDANNVKPENVVGGDALTALLQGACLNSAKTSTIGAAADCCKVMDKTNNFGENAGNYTNDKVTYLYDYEIKTWYKISKKGNSLDTHVISPGRESLGPYSELQLKIVNVNRFRFDVNSNGYFSSFDSQPPALFSQFFLGDQNLLGGLMTVYANNLKAAPLNSEGKIDPDYMTLLQKIVCFVDKYNGLNAQVLQAWNPCSKFPCCQDFDYQQFTRDLLEIRLRMAKYQSDLNDAKDALTKATKAIADCEQNTTDLAAANKQIDDINKNSKLSATDKKAQIDEQNAKIAKLNAIPCTPDKLTALKKEQDAQTAKVKNFSALTDLSAKLPTEATLNVLAHFINQMVYSSTVYSRTYPIAKGDKFNATIYVKSRDSLLKYIPFGSISPVTDTISLELPVLKKPMITFSSGSFIALNKNLKNKTYDWQQVGTKGVVSDTSKYRLAESGYSSPVLGFSALGNVEWRLANSFGIGGSAGVGLTIESNPRPSYLAGFSLFFGSERQFVTTFGYSGMQVNVLKNNLQAVVDQKIEYATTARPTIDYYKALRGSFFVSITFTPFTVVKK